MKAYDVWIGVACLIWLINGGYGLWRAFHDLADKRHMLAVMGFGCVLGVNALVGWLIYIVVSKATELP